MANPTAARRYSFRAAALAATVLLAAQSWLPAEPVPGAGRLVGAGATGAGHRLPAAGPRPGARPRSSRCTSSRRRLRAAVADHPVAVDSFESSLAWAYGLNWHPVPVLQTYVAYTAALDRRNADALERCARPTSGSCARPSAPSTGATRCGTRRATCSPSCAATARSCRTPAGCCWPRRATGAERPPPWRPGAVGRGAVVAVPEVAAGQLLVMSFDPAPPNPLVRLGRARWTRASRRCGSAVATRRSGCPGRWQPARWSSGCRRRRAGRPATSAACPARRCRSREPGTVRFSTIPLATG